MKRKYAMREQTVAIELSRATSQSYRDIAALQTESWRSAYRGMLPDSYLDGGIAEEREVHWRKLLSLDSERVGAFVATESGNLVGFVCVLLDASVGCSSG